MNRSILILPLSIVFLLTSCISVSDIVGGDDSESSIPVDEVGQLLSDIEQEEEEISNIDSTPNLENLELSEEKLDPTPTQNYDSVIIDKEDPENLVSPTTENSVERKKFQDYQNIISKLSINDKIQYRVATINFYSGSSLVDNVGLKKIRRIAKIAKERKAKIKIVGHASKRTRDMPLAKHKLVNFKISDQRAQSVANVFKNKFKFPSSFLITEAVSDTKPLFKENMPAGTKANQRTEIFLIY